MNFGKYSGRFSDLSLMYMYLVTIDFRNEKINSCDQEQFDFKIQEYNFGEIFGKLWDLLLYGNVSNHCTFLGPEEHFFVTWYNWI